MSFNEVQFLFLPRKPVRQCSAGAVGRVRYALGGRPPATHAPPPPPPPFRPGSQIFRENDAGRYIFMRTAFVRRRPHRGPSPHRGTPPGPLST